MAAAAPMMSHAKARSTYSLKLPTLHSPRGGHGRTPRTSGRTPRSSRPVTPRSLAKAGIALPSALWVSQAIDWEMEKVPKAERQSMLRLMQVFSEHSASPELPDEAVLRRAFKPAAEGAPFEAEAALATGEEHTSTFGPAEGAGVLHVSLDNSGAWWTDATVELHVE